jgi:hypothetical protein
MQYILATDQYGSGAYVPGTSRPLFATALALASEFGFTVSPQCSLLPSLAISPILRGSVLWGRLKALKHGVECAQTFKHQPAYVRGPHISITSSERSSSEFRSMGVSNCS